MGKNKLLVTLDNQKLCIIRSKNRENVVCVRDGVPSNITEELDAYVNLWYHLFPVL